MKGAKPLQHPTNQPHIQRPTTTTQKQTHNKPTRTHFTQLTSIILGFQRALPSRLAFVLCIDINVYLHA